jgi:hypothetical protein
MTAEAKADVGPSVGVPGKSVARAIDRWIFVFMAAFFIAIVFTGFIPDSMTKMALVEAGERPPFPLALHAHAVVMGAFLVLLLTQATLVATGRQANHEKLGLVGAVLALTLVIVGFILVPTMYHQGWNAAQAAPPEVRAGILEGLRVADNIMILQIRVGILFAVMIGIALSVRRKDSALHKRLMFLAIAGALPAAFDRMTWLPNTMPASPWGPELYTLVAVSPMFAWDFIRTRKVHKAYWIFGGLFAVATLITHLLWDTDWWHAMAPRLVGL